MRTYNLYLNTLITSPASNAIVPINITNKANAQWNVDFRTLFNGAHEKYRRCSVRFSMQSESWAASGTDWENYSGYLAISLPSIFGSSTTTGTLLGLINPIDCPTTGTTTHCYQISTLSDAQGVDIVIPTSNQLLNVMFVADDSFGLIASTMPNYSLLLQFEFSEPVSP